MKSIEDLRNEINAIDDKLAGLFVKRMDLALEIAEQKKEQNLPVLNSKREQEILQRITAEVREPLDSYARILFNTLFDVSRSYQHRHMEALSGLQNRIEKALAETPKIFPEKAVAACQGIEGAYSQLACEKLFAFPTIMYFNNFAGVFSAVEKGLCQYGILPIENSSYGSVGEVYDLMKNYNFHIARAVKLRVSHRLLAKPGTSLSEVREIFSHEQAIGQCREFLDSLKGVRVTVCENTAVAAQLAAASDRRDIAAISSANCAGLYGLEVLRDDIQLSDNNYTRFICISKNLQIFPGAGKVSLMLSLPHKPQSLYHMIANFSALGLNLTKLESRPIPGSDFEFMFYFDMDASIYSPELVNLLCQLESEPELFVFLGSYSEIN